MSSKFISPLTPQRSVIVMMTSGLPLDNFLLYNSVCLRPSAWALRTQVLQVLTIITIALLLSHWDTHCRLVLVVLVRDVSVVDQVLVRRLQLLHHVSLLIQRCQECLVVDNTPTNESLILNMYPKLA